MQDDADLARQSNLRPFRAAALGHSIPQRFSAEKRVTLVSNEFAATNCKT